MSTDRITRPLALLGGLSAQRFMARHWQRKPLLIRGAWPGVQPPVTRAELFGLAQSDAVESRLVVQATRAAASARSKIGAQSWSLQHGPFKRRALPPLGQPGWTLLVQGLNLHLEAAHRMLRAFDFIPQVRLDDLMVSYASDGGGVGPHVDSYDVFLLQVAGRRRWGIAPPDDTPFVPGLPLRILQHFKPQQEWVLEPGDMLYLPPGWGHEGVAVGGDCMTASIGFRAPTRAELVSALLARMGEEVMEMAGEEPPARSSRSRREPRSAWSWRHADPGQPATSNTGAIPDRLAAFAMAQVHRLLEDRGSLNRALGSWLTEPHPRVWFEPQDEQACSPDCIRDGMWSGFRLHRCSRMAYDSEHLFINGEAYRVGGRDARLLRTLADGGELDATAWRGLGEDARHAVMQWWQSGWLVAESSAVVRLDGQ